MVPNILQIVKKSIFFYRKPVLYQVLIIALLSAVITGSLLTGSSVRASLKKNASERLGNTGIMISSGLRYVDPSLAERMKDGIKINTSAILEINGYCQNLLSQKEAFNVHIYGVNKDFFRFNGNDTVKNNPGEISVNRKLADYLGLKAGDELIIRFNKISDIPADAPFSPSKESGVSAVHKIGAILEPDITGNFSLSISQITPLNVFINLSEIENITGKVPKVNRILIENKNDISIEEIYARLRNVMIPSDLGLSLRSVIKTGECELISDRIFIDGLIISEITSVLPSGAPVLTYLGNKFKAGTKSTPYSFVSALPSSLYPETASGNEMIINEWMAKDLAVSAGDTVEMFWYSPDQLNKLVEKSRKYIVSRIVDRQGIWSDSLLMPDFPGISGRESCSEWDAGVAVKMDDIRQEDEDYWKKFRGTPKAFISYEEGKEIWGSNFGPATSIRFPEVITEKEITTSLNGSFDPYKTGFAITSLYDESVKAADESVDFSTLFLSLGFFLILASIVLLSFAVTSYFESKRGQIKVLFSLGFRNRWIGKLLFLESVIIALIGCFIGAFAGYSVNIIITKALNSVWRGAVQTDTLEAFFYAVPLITGFAVTMLIIVILILVRIIRYLNTLNRKELEIREIHPQGKNFIFLLTSVIVFIAMILLTVLFKDQNISLFFIAGTVLLIVLILFWRQFFIGWIPVKKNRTIAKRNLSKLYYSFYPSHAVAPVLFIAAGVFAVFITGANRTDFNGDHLKRSGGTGGYLLWCENNIPLGEDLNSSKGRSETGLDDSLLKDMRFVHMKRSSGNDASCLNLNHITAPPLLGLDPSVFIERGSFSFARVFTGGNKENPWEYLNIPSENNTVYGIADQTVLEWGLKIKPGDTLILRAESGQPLKIIIAAGLKSSVFQGYVLIGAENFSKYYPSVSGSSILIVDGNSELSDLYKSTLNERLVDYGINIEQTNDRLKSFNEVTNTYLSVFMVFGAFGMVTGIAGLGFVLLRNYNHRKREFALMLATGYKITKIRWMILSEQILILFAGVTSGLFPAIVATLPSLTNSSDIPWLFLTLMIAAIMCTGLITLFFSVRAVTSDSLTASLRRE